MKLTIDLSGLISNAKRMGELQAFDLSDVWVEKDTFEVDDELEQGVDIDVGDIELSPDTGLLSYKGSQVVLYIPDHSFKVEDALIDGGKGNRFHVADCKTLDQMKQRRRFDRYRVTNNLTGFFDISGTHQEKNEVIQGKTKLNVCKNCLNMLNYKGASQLKASGRSQLVNEFSLEEFFSTYSSFFKKLPKQLAAKIKHGYTDDWAKISSQKRAEKNHTCQSCRVELSENKGLLHVHHMNGDKTDNSNQNLMVLCSDCHRKEPFHGHMHVPHKDTQAIQRLRMQQGIDIDSDWLHIERNADPALQGILRHCHMKGMPAPKLATRIKTPSQHIILDIAWVDMKRGVYIGDMPNLQDWELFNPREALVFFGGR